ncbi:MAG: hypothetical protein JRH20_23800 [Deltaproteobacteria bacterium]|nr:hypothetical protein [Deltaproteobacteria bacterium]
MSCGAAIITALALWVGPLLPYLGHDCDCAKRELQVTSSCCAKKAEHKATSATDKTTTSVRSHDVARGPCGCCPTGNISAGSAVAGEAPIMLSGPATARISPNNTLDAPTTARSGSSPGSARAPPGGSALHLLHCVFLI